MKHRLTPSCCFIALALAATGCLTEIQAGGTAGPAGSGGIAGETSGAGGTVSAGGGPGAGGDAGASAGAGGGVSTGGSGGAGGESSGGASAGGSGAGGASATVGNTAVGSAFADFGTDDKAANRITLASAGAIDKLAIYVDGNATGATGSMAMRGVVYATSASGEPAALLGSSQPVTVTAGAPPAWRDLVFSPSLALQAGNYWIGVHVGGTAKVIREAYAAQPSAMRYDGDDAFADGAESPFGASETGDKVMSLYAQIGKGGSPPAEPPPPPTGGQPIGSTFFCTFANGPTDCGFNEQAKVIGQRAKVIDLSTLGLPLSDGPTAVRLLTMPGDDNVNGSGSAERNDLSLSQAETDCFEGREHWWAHSVLFPSDYVPPPNPGWGVAMDFHHTGSSGQANFHLDAMPDGLRLRGYGGPTVSGGEFKVTLGPVVKNEWYDFVYHVKWSSGSDGFLDAWLDGKQVLSHKGATLYVGMGCYLKLANYHTANGQSSAVIHDRVVRGPTKESVCKPGSCPS